MGGINIYTRDGNEHRPMASRFYVGPVEILSELVKFPTDNGILWDLEVVRAVDKKVSGGQGERLCLYHSLQHMIEG